ncbi:sodium glucose cotransporter 1-like [Sigmodon hispidus]
MARSFELLKAEFCALVTWKRHCLLNFNFSICQRSTVAEDVAERHPVFSPERAFPDTTPQALYSHTQDSLPKSSVLPGLLGSNELDLGGLTHSAPPSASLAAASPQPQTLSRDSWLTQSPGIAQTLKTPTCILIIILLGSWPLFWFRSNTGSWWLGIRCIAGCRVNKSTEKWSMGISIYSSNIGSGHYMGLAGTGAASGIAAGALEWNTTIFMLFVLGWIFVPIYSKAEQQLCDVVTLPEYLRKRFGSVRIQLFLSFFLIVIYIFSRISMEISFGAMFLKMVWDTDIYQTMLVVLTITGLYTITGGMAAVAYVETLQAAIMILGSALLMGYAYLSSGGFSATNPEDWLRYLGGIESISRYILHTDPTCANLVCWTWDMCYIPRQDAFHIFRSWVSGDIPWPGLILGATTVSLFYGCADQVSVQRFLAAKSRLHMKGGCLLFGYLKLLPVFLMVMPGMISRILFSDQVACVIPSECQKFCGRQTGCSALAYPMLVIGLMPSGLKGFMMSTVCASVMSSLTSIFNSSSALFTLNIYTWIRPTATEKELMVAGRFFVIILFAVTIVWIPTMEIVSSEALFEYMQVLKSCLTPAVTAVFLLAVFCKRVNEQDGTNKHTAQQEKTSAKEVTRDQGQTYQSMCRENSKQKKGNLWMQKQAEKEGVQGDQMEGSGDRGEALIKWRVVGIDEVSCGTWELSDQMEGSGDRGEASS